MALNPMTSVLLRDTQRKARHGAKTKAATAVRGPRAEHAAGARGSRTPRPQTSALQSRERINVRGHVRAAPGGAGTFHLSASSLCPRGQLAGPHPPLQQAPSLPVLAGFSSGTEGGRRMKWGAFWGPAPWGSRWVARPLPLLLLCALLRPLGLEVRSERLWPALHAPWGSAPASLYKESLHHPPVKPAPQPRALPCQSLTRVTGTALPVH